MAVLRKRKQLPFIHHTPSSLRKLTADKGIDTLPLNLSALGTLLDIKIMKADLNGPRGLIAQDPSNTWTIFYNNRLAYPTNRHSVAYLISHYCLHRETYPVLELYPLLLNPAEKGIAEKTAAFCRELLMPKNEFAAKIKEFNGDVGKLAEIYQLPAAFIVDTATVYGYNT